MCAQINIRLQPNTNCFSLLIIRNLAVYTKKKLSSKIPINVFSFLLLKQYKQKRIRMAHIYTSCYIVYMVWKEVFLY